MPLTRGTVVRSTGLLTWVNQSGDLILHHHFCAFMFEDVKAISNTVLQQLKLNLSSILL